MGNCQAAEAATVVLQHSEGKVERMHWSIGAREVMASNPGYYVAMFVAPPGQASTSAAAARPQRHLKLMRPDDTLHVGHVYRLVSFEEVLKEIASKKNGKLSKLRMGQKERGNGGGGEEKRKRKERRRGGGGGRSKREEEVEQPTAAAIAAGDEQKQNEESNRQQQVVGEEEEEEENMGGGFVSGGGSTIGFRRRYGGGQWRPTLQSIAEIEI